MGRPIDRTKRRAAGAIFLAAFHVNNALGHMLYQVLQDHPVSGEGCGLGLTPSEKKFVGELKNKYYRHGQVLLRLGWRMLK